MKYLISSISKQSLVGRMLSMLLVFQSSFWVIVTNLRQINAYRMNM